MSYVSLPYTRHVKEPEVPEKLDIAYPSHKTCCYVLLLENPLQSSNVNLKQNLY